MMNITKTRHNSTGRFKRIPAALLGIALLIVSILPAGGCTTNTDEENDFFFSSLFLLLSSVSIQCQLVGNARAEGCGVLDLNFTTSLVAGDQATNGLVNGTGTTARFDNPTGITSDGTNLYLADQQNHVIRKISIATGEVTTLAGSGAAGNADGIGTAATFNQPFGITRVGPFLYVGDIGSDIIRRVTIDTGETVTIAGSANNPGLVNGTGTAAQFNNPMGFTSDFTNLYVSEGGNYTIRKINLSSLEVTTVAGSGVQSSVNGIGTAASFTQILGLNYTNGNLYAPDLGVHAVRKINLTTQEVTTFAGEIGTSGTTDGVGTAARFNGPRDITNDGSFLYVTDTLNSTIRRIELATGNVQTVVGQAGTAGHTEGTGPAATLTFPGKIVTDGRDLYFVGATFHYIRKVD